MNPNRRDLLLNISRVPGLRPNSGESGNAPAGNGHVATSADKRLFHAPHKLDRPQCLAGRILESAQVEYGIAHQLSWPVVGHITAAVALRQLYASLCQRFCREQHVAQLGISTQSYDRKMFQQQQRVGDAALFAQLYQLLLKRLSRPIFNPPELKDLDQSSPRWRNVSWRRGRAFAKEVLLHVLHNNFLVLPIGRIQTVLVEDHLAMFAPGAPCLRGNLIVDALAEFGVERWLIQSGQFALELEAINHARL